MTEPVAELKAFVFAQLSANCDPFPPKSATSRQVHLSVWKTRERPRVIGAELDLKERVNLWVVSMYAPPILPDSVSVSKKVWQGAKWHDKHPDPERSGRDGANSNLKGYDEFRTRPITRLGIQSVADARTVLEQLFA